MDRDCGGTLSRGASTGLPELTQYLHLREAVRFSWTLE